MKRKEFAFRGSLTRDDENSNEWAKGGHRLAIRPGGGPNRGDNREEHEGRDATSLGNEREALEGVKIGTIE